MILQNLFAKERVVLFHDLVHHGSTNRPVLVRVGQLNEGKHHDADIIFGWNKNEGNWFAVYLLEGYSKDHQSLIQQDTFVRNLNKCGLRLNEIGISTVAFEYGPWSRSQVGKPEG